MKITKPWGYEELIESERYVVKRLFMLAGHQCSLQLHERKRETVVVFSGQLELVIGDTVDALETRTMFPGDVVTIAPKVVHRMRAISDCTYYEASTCELDDVVRIQDDYARQTRVV
jgi:mannose-6-phosphate isomerase-like protein (cupin superfamily)